MSLTIAASPMGKRIGLTAATGSERQILLTVAPKAWRDKDHLRYFTVEDLPGGHVEMSLFEGDRLHLTRPTEDTEDAINALLRASRKSKDPETIAWEAALVSPEVAPRSPVVTGLPAPADSMQTANLLRLFQRVELLFADSANLQGRAGRSPLHRPLAVREFLDEVELRLGQARRGYRRVVEDRYAVRGRISAASIARFQATGGSRLRCSFDELTESTQLLGIVATTLEMVADGHGPSSVLPRPFDERRLRHDAVRLRRALGEVASFPIGAAVNLSGRLKLSRLDAAWTKALRLANVLLRDGEIVAKNAAHRDAQAVELSVETDKVWEWIVNAALRRTRFDTVLDQGQQIGLTQDPWLAHPLQVSINTWPDNIAFQRQEVFVVDAKYKLNAKPSRDDQYQMYAYSHLVRSEGRDVRAAVLVYPGSAAGTQWIRGRDSSTQPVRLYAVQLPFPMPDDLVSSRSWETYLDRTGTRLGRELRLAQTDGEKLERAARTRMLAIVQPRTRSVPVRGGGAV